MPSDKHMEKARTLWMQLRSNVEPVPAIATALAECEAELIQRMLEASEADKVARPGAAALWDASQDGELVGLPQATATFRAMLTAFARAHAIKEPETA